MWLGLGLGLHRAFFGRNPQNIAVRFWITQPRPCCETDLLFKEGNHAGVHIVKTTDNFDFTVGLHLSQD